MAPQRKLREIPPMEQLLAAVGQQPLLAQLPRTVLVDTLRQATEEFRHQIIAGSQTTVTIASILEIAETISKEASKPKLQPVVNATGVILHTNLGRAPLSKRAQERVVAVMAGYSTLEYDTSTGQRGSRYSHVADRICQLTGAEAALVVNNNAAAVLLVLSALACGQEVIISRGQLVEIGGSFRIPEVLQQSGATLVETGTTNKTHLKDYAKSISPNTAAILKVHTSNYKIIGFTSQPDERGLVELAHSHGLLALDNLGSGALTPVSVEGWDEPTVAAKLANGFDIVTCSGDKLLGGSQAGIIAGKKKYLDILKNHPLLRAIRIDKLSLAAMEGTLLDYCQGNPQEDIPVQKMMGATMAELKGRAEVLAAQINGLSSWQAEVLLVDSLVGGGAMPGQNLASYGVQIAKGNVSAREIENQLRSWITPIIARISEDKVMLDVRCLGEKDCQIIVDACVAREKN